MSLKGPLRQAPLRSILDLLEPIFLSKAGLLRVEAAALLLRLVHAIRLLLVHCIFTCV